MHVCVQVCKYVNIQMTYSKIYRQLNSNEHTLKHQKNKTKQQQKNNLLLRLFFLKFMTIMTVLI